MSQIKIFSETAPSTPETGYVTVYSKTDKKLYLKDDAGTETDLTAGSGGSGTVTSVSVTTANGVSGSVANATTTPAISLTLGAITPTSVAASGAVSGSNLSGTNTGDQTISLTGDVTGSGTGSFAATIANDAVTYAKMQNVSATSRILGRKTAAAGDTEECTLSEVLDFVGSPAQGDILYRGASSWTRLGAGTTGHFLKTQGTGADPVWAAASGSGAVATDAIWDAKGDLAVGTGADTASRLAVGTNGQVLTADSAEATGLKWTTVSGTGDVVGPASSTDNAVARFDSTTGKLIQNSVVTIGDTGNMAGVGTLNTHTIPGGTGTIALTSDITGTNSGVNTGDQTITLTGGVTGSGTGSFAATVVTNANLTGPITSVGNATTIADPELAAIAGLVSAADKLPYFTGSGTASLADFTAAGRALVDDADAAAQRTTLGLGTVATLASDTDGTLAANSDSNVATQKATKTYADAKVSDTAYSASSWDGVTTIAPSKNAIRDKLELNQNIVTDTDGATITFDISAGSKHRVTLAGNRTLALTSSSFGLGSVFAIKLTQDATGSRTVTWFSGIKWPAGTTPTLTTTAGRSDWFCFICTNSGTPTFDALAIQQNLPA